MLSTPYDSIMYCLALRGYFAQFKPVEAILEMLTASVGARKRRWGILVFMPQIAQTTLRVMGMCQTVFLSEMIAM